MRSEWKEHPLGEITELIIDYRGKTPQKLGGDWSDHGYRALSAKNIKTGKIVQPDTIRYVDETLYHKWMKDEIKRGDILITSEAPFGQIYFWNSDEKIVLSQRLFGVRIQKDYDPRFIYYYMTTPEFQGELSGRATGTTVIGLRQPELLKCVVRCPNVLKQHKISSVLSVLDEKIEFNEKLNDNLEQQASALVGHYMQSIDTSVSIANIMSFDSGFPFQSSTYLPSGKYRIITIKNVQDGNIETSNTVFINNLPTRMKNNCILHVGDVLLSLTGNVGRVGIVCEENLLLNQRVAKIVPNDIGLLPLLYFIFRQPDIKLQMELIAKGTAQSNLSPVETLRLTIPFERKTAEALSRTLAPMYQTIISTTQESHSLSSLRDALLPKLMSGEIDVSEVEL